jgi:4-hydroxybutyryl-CoA dehydratase/vinylacetyl-CoA-Delta-isomerase
MVIKTAKQYIESLRKINPEFYAFGEKIENVIEHPLIKPSINSVAVTYELANDPEYEDLMTARSSINNEKINRFNHLFITQEDLIKKVKMLRLCGQKTGTCFVRCLGMDAINALFITTYKIDKKYGTEYHNRLKKFIDYIQKNDLTCHASMTDVKGDRSKRPSEQSDPDLYLHVVEERRNGIIVRGAKAHQTGAGCAHEAIVMPTCRMLESDKKYAIAFAIPTNAKGIIYVYGRFPMDTREIEGIDVGNIKYGKHSPLMIFDDVFVPWDRVFMYQEYEFAEEIVTYFSAYHRQSHGGCKAGMNDVLIGATSLIAKYNGVDDASHIKSKIADMVHLVETIYSCAIASSVESRKTEAGIYFVNNLLANVSKLNEAKNCYEIARLAQDIAGGLVATMPSEKDLKNEKVGKFIEKYLKGKPEVPTINRMKVIRLIEHMTLSIDLLSDLHGAGSPEAQKIGIRRLANIEEKEKLVKSILNID